VALRIKVLGAGSIGNHLSHAARSLDAYVVPGEHVSIDTEQDIQLIEFLLGKP
jgi:hypothetical protein